MCGVYMKKLASILYIAFVLMSHAAIAQDSTQHAARSTGTAYIDSLTAEVPIITAQALRKMLAAGKDDVVLLDVRTFYERNETKTVQGEMEVHIPRGFLEVKAWDAIAKDKTIVVYCSKGTRSKLAARTLLDMGWTRVVSLEGGIRAWYASMDKNCGCLPDDQEIPAQQSAGSTECKP